MPRHDRRTNGEAMANGTGTEATTTRRAVLRATAAGATGLALGSPGIGSAAAAETPAPPLTRCGNRLLDPTGQPVILRGVNVADPGRQLREWRGQTAEETVALALDETATAPADAEVADVTGWHADVIRIPAQPQDVYTGTDNAAPESEIRDVTAHGDFWGPILPGDHGGANPITEATLDEYFGEIVDPLIDQIEAAGAYAMIDYHRHFPVFHQVQRDWEAPDYPCSASTSEHDVGGCGERGVLWHGAAQREDVVAEAPEAVAEAVDDGVWTESVCEALDEELRTFWRFVAEKYADRDHVLFDAYNEPGGPYHGDWGAPDRMPLAVGGSGLDADVRTDGHEVWWDLWRERAQPWLDVIDEHAPGSVVAIGSPRWSQYTYWAAESEFDAGSLQLCYDGHVYMEDSLRPLADFFGEPAREVPVFLGEFGWAAGGGGGDFTIYDGRTEEADARAEFESLFESHPIHPIASWFDHTWEPAFFDGGGPDEGAPAKGPDETWMDYLEPYADTHAQWWMEYLARKRGSDDPEAGSGVDACPPDRLDPVGDNENPPTDPDDDGLYEDVNGNENRDMADAVDLYQHRDSAAVRDNVDAYDFSGNDRVDLADVVQLFQENAG